MQKQENPSDHRAYWQTFFNMASIRYSLFENIMNKCYSDFMVNPKMYRLTSPLIWNHMSQWRTFSNMESISYSGFGNIMDIWCSGESKKAWFNMSADMKSQQCLPQWLRLFSNMACISCFGFEIFTIKYHSDVVVNPKMHGLTIPQT